VKEKSAIFDAVEYKSTSERKENDKFYAAAIKKFGGGWYCH